MEKGILHLHVTVVVLFLILLLLKTILLLANSKGTLQKLRDKTRIFDMILGTLILLTGGYLLTIVRIETYLIVKIVLTLIGIPLGIVAFKKENKVLAILALLTFVYVYGVAETDSWKMKPDKIEVAGTGEGSELTAENVKALYINACASCHGEDGKLGQAGAKDLTQTGLSKSEIEEVIKNGRGIMPPFKSRLSEKEIEALTKYVDALN